MITSIAGCSPVGRLFFHNDSTLPISVHVIADHATLLAWERRPHYVSASTLDTLHCGNDTPRFLGDVSIFVFDSTYASRVFERASSDPLTADSALARYEFTAQDLISMKWTVRFPK
jgi:hypothetical protein